MSKKSKRKTTKRLPAMSPEFASLYCVPYEVKKEFWDYISKKTGFEVRVLNLKDL